MRLIALLCCALSVAAAGPTVPVVSETLATQVALDRAGFSPGEIDGRAGKNLQRALDAFKQSHDQPLSLLGDVPPLTEYTITDADVAGPFTPDIPPNLPDQAPLDALNYRSPLELLGERFHSSPALLQQLNPQATFQQAGEKITVPNVMPFVPATPAPAASPTSTRPAPRGQRGSRAQATPPAQPASPAPDLTVYVTKSTSALTVEDATGKILMHAPVTSGSIHDPLPIGTWKVNGIQRNPKFHYNPELFWDATPGDRKVTLQPGPNNPVGIVWVDLSKEHYGIHGTPEPSKIGHVESHGCVRLTNWDADRLSQMVKPGIRVVFRE
ncbi:MAG TPA: L,D-transpeptidase [Vicinamibacterales bacterium]|jgi:lipoprotein-anchoring transpeptidase ErfK/SrfK